MEITLSFVLLIAALIIGIPVPMAFFGVTVFLIIFGGYDPSFLLPYGYNKMSNMVLLAMPLFIMAKSVIEKGGLGKRLVDFIELFFGRIKGGLGIVAVVSCAVFGAISGSSNATQSVIGAIMWPRLDAAGYSKGFSAALLASAALLGSFIPPSGIMIIYAWISGCSVLACFLAVFAPGLILTLLFSIFTYIWCQKNEPNIHMMPSLPRKELPKHFLNTTTHAIPALLFPVIILGGIYGGFVTPTEAAALSVLYAVPVGLWIYRGINGRGLYKVLVQTATTTGVIVVMLYCVMMLSRIYITEDLPGMIAKALTGVSQNKYL
ncbi:MAG: TRAP transporter large permease, partial [Clostridiales bacterium]